MLLALAIASALAQQNQTPDLVLERGGSIPERQTRYWSAEDTVLDSKQPNANFGGELFSETGPGRPLLLRFGDLNRAVGPGKRVKSASIRLSVAGGGIPFLKSANRVLVSWAEGPALAAAPIIRNPAEKPVEASEAFPGSATWNHRHAGPFAVGWQSSGAQGPSDVAAIPSAKLTPAGEGQVLIEGLEAAVNAQLDNPGQNFGFLLQFEEATTFFSCQANEGRPCLELTLEAVGPKAGPDLSVVDISSSPQYPRYSNSDLDEAPQDGVSVGIPRAPANASAQHTPKEGETITYTARIRNIGAGPATGFSIRWSPLGKQGSVVELSRSLQPGQETTVSTTLAYKSVESNATLRPITLDVMLTADVNPANNSRTIYENGVSLSAVVAQSVAEALGSGQNAFGARSAEDWLQAHVDFLNGVAFPQSRFSFARWGILERVRWQQIRVVPDAAFAEDAAVASADLNVDGCVLLGPGFKPNRQDVDRVLLQRIGEQMGLVSNLGVMDPSVRPKELVGHANFEDYKPGIMGYGDTRYEGFAPPQAALTNGPYRDGMLAFIRLEDTDLFSATDVSVLNSAIGKRRGTGPLWLYALPSVVVISPKDTAGLPLDNAEITYYPMAGGVFRLEAPIGSDKTDSTGLNVLKGRPIEPETGIKIWNGATLKVNPFGRVALDGSNSAILVKAAINGDTDWKVLKVWQVLDAVRRNNGLAVIPMRFNIADAPSDPANNLASGRIVTDSANGLPAQLLSAIDGDLGTKVSLGAGDDAWIEIDLGRDRSINEVQIVSGEGMWQKFDILGYGTGQTAADAMILTYENDWAWSFAHRSLNSGAIDVRAMPYRFRTRRIRYLRLANRGPVAAAALHEIRVLAPNSP